MTDATRKAVITTAQVSEALTGYLAVRKEIGFTDGAYEFDKGARGKGFALYNGPAVVTNFETKEEAYVHFTRYTEVAREVLAQIQTTTVDPTAEAKKPASRKPSESVAA